MIHWSLACEAGGVKAAQGRVDRCCHHRPEPDFLVVAVQHVNGEAPPSGDRISDLIEQRVIAIPKGPCQNPTSPAAI